MPPKDPQSSSPLLSSSGWNSDSKFSKALACSERAFWSSSGSSHGVEAATLHFGVAEIALQAAACSQELGKELAVSHLKGIGYIDLHCLHGLERWGEGQSRSAVAARQPATPAHQPSLEPAHILSLKRRMRSLKLSVHIAS